MQWAESPPEVLAIVYGGKGNTKRGFYPNGMNLLKM